MTFFIEGIGFMLLSLCTEFPLNFFLAVCDHSAVGFYHRGCRRGFGICLPSKGMNFNFVICLQFVVGPKFEECFRSHLYSTRNIIHFK